MSSFLKKPKRGKPCNGCGFCCMLEVCGIGLTVHGIGTQAPCPSLRKTGDRYICGLVAVEERLHKETGHPQVIANALGIGVHCDADDSIHHNTLWEHDMKTGVYKNIKDEDNGK